jgi:hypothetical protein
MTFIEQRGRFRHAHARRQLEPNSECIGNPPHGADGQAIDAPTLDERDRRLVDAGSALELDLPPPAAVSSSAEEAPDSAIIHPPMIAMPDYRSLTAEASNR